MIKWERLSAGRYRLDNFEVTQHSRKRWEIWAAPESGWSPTGAYPARKGPTLIEAFPTMREARHAVELEIMTSYALGLLLSRPADQLASLFTWDS